MSHEQGKNKALTWVGMATWGAEGAPRMGRGTGEEPSPEG